MSKLLEFNAKLQAPALLALFLASLYLARLYSYLLFHSLAELFSIVVAAAIFILVWNSRRFIQNGYLLWLGLAYLFVAILETLHTLSYKGMGVFQGWGVNLPTQLWLAARLVHAGALLLAPLFLAKRPNEKATVAGFAGVTALLLASIFYWDYFPTAYADVEQRLTDFKIYSEYIVSMAFLVAAGLLWLKRSAFAPGVLRLLLASIACLVVSEILFTAYTSPYGFANLMGHYFLLLSFYFVYKAVIETGLRRPYELLFRELKKSEEAVRQSQERYQSLVELCPDAILVLADGCLAYVNRAGAALFGAAAGEELVGRNFFELADEHSRDVLKSLLTTAETSDSATPFVEVQMRRLDGKTFDVEIAGVRISHEEGGTAVQAVLSDITARKQWESEIRAANERLEQRVCERTEEARRRALQLRVLASELSQAEQRERRRLAQFLHDHLQQFLVAAKMEASTVRARAADAGMRAVGRRLDDLLQQAIEASRSLTTELCPPVLYEAGLPAALVWLGEWKQSKYNLRVEVEADERANPENENVRVLLFLAVRELLFNVVKHAGTDCARVVLGVEDGTLHILVEDHGNGFDPGQIQDVETAGFGLFSIRERLEMFGGSIEIDSRPGGGTSIRLRAPALGLSVNGVGAAAQ